jgi:hypothetical protein
MNYALRTTHYEKPLIVAITLLAFALRLWQLGSVPPGWRDDELINVLVISQKVLAGDWQVYYADASGNEAFYHALNAVMYGLFGFNFLGVRLLSVFFGVTAVPLTWLLGRKLFGSTVGLLAAAALALSFWSLMYSRFGLRQIATPTLMLLAFYFFWRGVAGGWWLVAGGKSASLQVASGQVASEQVASGKYASGKSLRTTHYALRNTEYGIRITDYALAGFFTALGFYVYFAGRGVPLILLAFCGYMVVVARPLFKQNWRGLVLMFGVTAVLALPLVITLQRQPEAEARVGELAGPLLAAREGDFSLIQKHLVATLSMFHADGDAEWLYNIPHRPLFGPIGALCLWLGVLIAAYYTFKPVLRIAYYVLTRRSTVHCSLFTAYCSLPHAFLLLWWLAGISPGFISVPPASLGHTILAQPATYLLMALPVGVVGNWVIGNWRMAQLQITNYPITQLPALLSVLLLFSIAIHDWPDYFVNWPQRGMVRFLYRANVAELADYLNKQPGLTDFAVGGLLDGPWDKVALWSDLEADTAVSPRWFHWERAVFLRPSFSFASVPAVPAAYDHLLQPVAEQPPVGDFTLAQVKVDIDTTNANCFENGLCSIAATYDPTTGILELGWWLARPLQIPPFQLISNPPPPGVYAGPRLLAFGQLLDADGNFIFGDDGFWVDPYTLQPGDVFLQQHHLTPPAGSQPITIAFGLYDPMTGERILTDDGRDHLTLEIGD